MNAIKIIFDGATFLLPDLTEFKRITGIIGYPLDAHDPELYALDRNIDIIMEVNFT